jgi:hypothetical protein
MKETMEREFFEAWPLYDQVLENNYIIREELYQDVQHLIVNRYAECPVMFLDLGYGSVRHLVYTLEGL